MYAVFRPFWRRKMPHLYTQMTVPKRLRRPRMDLELPRRIVAAKFYNSQACAKNHLHTRMVNDIVRAVAATSTWCCCTAARSMTTTASSTSTRTRASIGCRWSR